MKAKVGFILDNETGERYHDNTWHPTEVGARTSKRDKDAKGKQVHTKNGVTAIPGLAAPKKLNISAKDLSPASRYQQSLQLEDMYQRYIKLATQTKKTD